MPLEVEFPTRHTDAFAGTGFVHAGVLLALTEMAYASFEKHCGLSKAESVYAVQRATEVTYRSPLRWQEGAIVRVRTLSAGARGFDQEFEVRSAGDRRLVATFTHHWAWFDTATSEPISISDADQERLLEG